MNMNQKGFASIALVAIIVVIIAVGGYFVLIREQKPVAQQTTPTPVTTQTPTSQQPSPTPINETASWKTYKNEKYKFQFNYPANWAMNMPTQSGVGYFQIQIETTLSDGSTARFDVFVHQTQIDILTYERYKGTFEGRVTYFYDFNNCVGEMNSTVACVTKVIQILIGPDNKFTFGGRDYLKPDVVEIRYGVFKSFSVNELKSKGVTNLSNENINQALGLYNNYKNVEPELKQILSTFKFTN
jgi:hypothetical protein